MGGLFGFSSSWREGSSASQSELNMAEPARRASRSETPGGDAGVGKPSRSERDRARRLDLALDKIQRRDLRKLLGTDALVDRIAEAIALHKTGKLIGEDPYVIDFSDDDLGDLQVSIFRVQHLLRKMELANVAHELSHRLENPIINGQRVPPPFTLVDTSSALAFLRHAVDFMAKGLGNNKGGRPRKTTGELLFSLVSEIVPANSKARQKTLYEVLRIAFEAGGEDAEECDKFIERRRVAARRAKKDKPPRK
jgi:hypothetical protein